MGKEKKREITPFRQTIIHEGFVDFNELFESIKDWLDDNEYDVFVKKISQSVKPDGGEIEVEIEADRDISPYVNYHIDITLWLLRGRKVTKEYEGKSTSGRKGKLEIKIAARMEKDYKGKFEGTSFARFLREIYERYIIKNVLAGKEAGVYVQGKGLSEDVKDVLESYK